MAFDTILFDLDGTLTDPKEGITKCCQYGLRFAGVDVEDLDELEQFIGPPLLDAFQEVYGITEEQAHLAVEKYRVRFEKTGIYENVLLPGIPEMLQKLKSCGKRLCIASSKPEPFVRRITEHFGIARWFDEQAGGSMDEKRSGKAAVIAEALRRLGIPEGHTEGVLMVGDRKHDVEGAHAHGIETAAVTFGYGSMEELTRAGADYIVRTVEELERLILEGQGAADR